MPEFLELVETLRAEEASVERLYAGEGRSIKTMRRTNPVYLAALAEAAQLIADVQAGRKPTHRLQEALGTADFPLLFGDVIDRQILANYQATPVTWPAIAKRSTVPDFRTVKRFAINGAETVLDPVAPQSEYPETLLSDAVYSYAVGKYGRKLPLAWETIINDDLQALTDIPLRLGRAAARSEEKFATQLFATSTGPDSSFYTSGHKNSVSGNPALSISALQSAMTLLLSQVDTGGDPIEIDMVTLVVPPSLEVVAQNLLNATQIRYGDAPGTSNELMYATNWMQRRFRLVTNHYLPIVDTTHGTTAWYLFGDPQAARPALEMGFLRGHETPETFMQEPNAVRVGGGAVTPMDGDFNTDSIVYKIRHVFGGTKIDYRLSVASNGSGS